MPDAPELPDAPRGQQYGQRKATEDALAQVPLPDGGGAPPAAPPAGRDPLEVAQQFQPPNIMAMDDTAVDQLPVGQPPQPGMPQANMDALSMLPLLPGLVRAAELPGASGSFRAWVRRMMAEVPPEARMSDLFS
jgi:hypothetical protein